MGMDIPRTGEAQKRRTRRTIMIVVGIAAISLVTFGLSRLEPAAPTVQKETVWIDTVQRGPMLRSVRGPGTLVPVDVRWISAPVDARIERIPALPGVTVTADTVLMEMSDPQIEQNAVEAQSQLKGAQADFDNLKAQLDSQVLSQQAQVTLVKSQSEQAKLQAEADLKLFKEGLLPDITHQLSALKSEQLVKQAKIEEERYEQNKRSADAQLAAQRARVEQNDALYKLRQHQVDSLKVRAGIPGVLQELPVQVGQRVTAGTVLARVARPEKLKAELHIPEVQAKDVKLGLTASIDTRNGLVSGRAVGAGRHGDRRRRPRRQAAGRRPPGPLGGRHDRDRAAGERALRRPSQLWESEQQGGAVQAQRGRKIRRPHAGRARPHVGQHGRDRQGPAGRRQGDPVGHLGAGRVQKDPFELTP
jgi:HlyD family secretion protein